MKFILQSGSLSTKLIRKLGEAGLARRENSFQRAIHLKLTGMSLWLLCIFSKEMSTGNTKGGSNNRKLQHF